MLLWRLFSSGNSFSSGSQEKKNISAQTDKSHDIKLNRDRNLTNFDELYVNSCKILVDIKNL